MVDLREPPGDRAPDRARADDHCVCARLAPHLSSLRTALSKLRARARHRETLPARAATSI